MSYMERADYEKADIYTIGNYNTSLYTWHHNQNKLIVSSYLHIPLYISFLNKN